MKMIQTNGRRQSLVGSRLALGLATLLLVAPSGQVFGVPQAEIPHPAYESKPLPAKQPDRSRRIFDAMLTRNRRTLGDAYTTSGQRDSKWDANAQALLEGLALIMSEQPNAPALSAMLALADACRAAGCQDPLVEYSRGYCLAELGRPDEAETCFRKALEEFEAHETYPYLRMAYVPLRLARLHFTRDKKRTEETDRLCDLSIRWLAESIRRNETRPEELQVLHMQISCHFKELEHWGYPPEKLGLALYRQSEGAGKSNIWIRNIVLADYHITTGWNARGTGYANEVTDQGRKVFGENIAAAARLLREAYPLHPEFPDVARRFMIVAKAGGTPENEPPRFWFDRAVAADFTDLESYAAFLPNLQPRWHGSLQQMLDFGRECLATERYDTPVPGLYMTILDMIGNDLPDNPGAVFKKPNIYADVKELMARVFENKKVNAQWMQARFACAAYWAGDRETARHFATELGPRWERYMGEDNPFAVPKEKMINDLGLAPEIFGAQPNSPPRFDTTFELSAPGATSVFLIGTFNNWNPTSHAMAKDQNGIWRITLHLPAFMYGYQFLVDGVPQLDPAATDTLQEENGPKGSLRSVCGMILTVTAPSATNSEPAVTTILPKQE